MLTLYLAGGHRTSQTSSLVLTNGLPSSTNTDFQGGHSGRFRWSSSLMDQWGPTVARSGVQRSRTA